MKIDYKEKIKHDFYCFYFSFSETEWKKSRFLSRLNIRLFNFIFPFVLGISILPDEEFYKEEKNNDK